MQDQDTLKEDCHDWEVVTDVKPTEDQLKAMMFAWKAVKHAKSNAIVVANNERTLGVGKVNQTGLTPEDRRQARRRLGRRQRLGLRCLLPV